MFRKEVTKHKPVFSANRVVSWNGQIDIYPKLLPMKRNTQSHKENLENCAVAGENTSYLSAYLFQALFGGESAIARDRSVDFGFRPDHILDTPLGEIATEIKAVSIKKGSPFCGAAQFGSYSQRLLERYEEGHPHPVFQYAFLRYGPGHENAKFYKHTETELPGVFAESVRNLLVVPQNLAMFLFYHGADDVMDQRNHRGNTRTYFFPLGGHIQLLHDHAHEPQNAFEKIRSRSRFSDSELASNLLLEDLLVDQYTSPSDIYIFAGRKTSRVKPFTVTHYRNKDPGKWLRQFSRMQEEFAFMLTGGMEFPSYDDFGDYEARETPEEEYVPF